MKIVSWHNVLTHHQLDLFKSLQKLNIQPIHFVIGNYQLSERSTQGWVTPIYDGLNIVTLDNRRWLGAGLEIIRKNPNAIHIFGGIWADRRFLFFIIYALYRKIRVVLICEPYSDITKGYYSDNDQILDRIKLWLRPYMYKLFCYYYGTRIKLLFAISEKAITQYSSAGFPINRIAPFGYFIPSINGLNKNINKTKPLKMIFIGSLIARKGIMIAIEAVNHCVNNGLPIQLDIYGTGLLGKIINREDVAISYMGAIPFGAAQNVIPNYDVMLLPSLFDGWGVVVNEAILQDVPVIVSDQVGASIIIKDSGAGAIFESGNISQLIDVLSLIIKNRKILDRWKVAAQEYKEKILPDYAANYMMACLRAVEEGSQLPESPWYHTD